MHFLMCISISSLGLQTTNKEIFIMDSYSIETASFMGPMKYPVYKMLFEVLLVSFTPRIMARFTGQDRLHVKLSMSRILLLLRLAHWNVQDHLSR